MKKINNYWFLLLACLFVSVLSHAFFIEKWFEGIYMIGPDDGLSQMVPFREMLYDHYSNGDFFYSYEYGLGGGTFSQLAYYYATNVVFWIVSLFVFLLEAFRIIQEPDVLFWAQATLFISIVRLSVIIMLTTCVFRYIRLPLVPSFTGAVIYGASHMYFRHVTYWEFFSDAFLWLPLLFLGIEKIIREAKPGWLIVAVAISTFDNFYFAFIHCVFAVMYIAFRWFIPLIEGEIKRTRQIKLFAFGVALGAGIGSFSFIPAVYGFLNNYRPPYEDSIPLFDLEDNILLDDYRFLLPAIFVLLFFVFQLYRNKIFRLFALFSFVIIVMHYMPIMWSFFNGFSAPQRRFEYLGYFSIGAAVAAGLSMWKSINWKAVLLSSLGAFSAYIYFFYRDDTYDFHDLTQSVTVVSIFLTFLVWLLLANKKVDQAVWLLCVTVIAANTAITYQFQEEKLYGGRVNETTKDYILSEDYYSAEQKSLIDEVLNTDRQPLARMEWKTDGRNNTPIIQGFTGTSVYSSVLNKNLLFFYYHDLEIDMKRESVSRYAGFGNRANLHSLFAGTYVMREADDDDPIPYGFSVRKKTNEYIIYENTNRLPFVRATDQIYSEEAIKETEILAREHAMLDGVVINHPEGKTQTPPQVENLIDQVVIEEIGAEYEDGELLVTEETGGIDLKVTNPPPLQGDYYVSFYLNQAEGMVQGFPLHVNDFRTTRKPADSIYRTKVNKLTIRVDQAETIAIRMPKGNYRLENLELYHEDYRKLENAVTNSAKNAKVDIDGSRISIQYDNNTGNRYLTIPVPYEKGWQVRVNGERKKLEKANFAFLGTKLDPGTNEIEFVYYPPYFKWTMVVSIISLAAAIGWVILRKRKRNREKLD